MQIKHIFSITIIISIVSLTTLAHAAELTLSKNLESQWSDTCKKAQIPFESKGRQAALGNENSILACAVAHADGNESVSLYGRTKGSIDFSNEWGLPGAIKHIAWHPTIAKFAVVQHGFWVTLDKGKGIYRHTEEKLEMGPIRHLSWNDFGHLMVVGNGVRIFTSGFESDTGKNHKTMLIWDFKKDNPIDTALWVHENKIALAYTDNHQNMIESHEFVGSFRSKKKQYTLAPNNVLVDKINDDAVLIAHGNTLNALELDDRMQVYAITQEYCAPGTSLISSFCLNDNYLLIKRSNATNAGYSIVLYDRKSKTESLVMTSLSNSPLALSPDRTFAHETDDCTVVIDLELLQEKILPRP